MLRLASLFLLLGVALAQTGLDIDFNCNTFVATDAVVDTAVSNSPPGGSAVTIHDGSLTGDIHNFQFLLSGRFTINATSASLSGQLVPTGATSLAHGYYFLLNLQLAPDASGRNMLQAGVSVDQSSWMYFSIATPSYIVGYGDFLTNGPINIAQLVSSLPFQVGVGANGKNLNFGASVAIDITAGPYHVAGDVNIDLSCDLAAHQSSSSSSNELPSSSSQQESSDSSSSQGGVVCIADIKDCADGSTVGRDPSNNCQFFECPAPGSSSSSSSSSVESSSSSSQPASSSSSSGEDNGCSVHVDINRANTWNENGRLTTLIYVTFTNTGTRDIKDVAMAINDHGDNCASFAPSCIRQYWSMTPASCASPADAVSCVFGLPDWLTLYGGLRVHQEHNWGFITFSADTDLTVTPTCF